MLKKNITARSNGRICWITQNVKKIFSYCSKNMRLAKSCIAGTLLMLFYAPGSFQRLSNQEIFYSLQNFLAFLQLEVPLNVPCGRPQPFRFLNNSFSPAITVQPSRHRKKCIRKQELWSGTLKWNQRNMKVIWIFPPSTVGYIITFLVRRIKRLLRLEKVNLNRLPVLAAFYIRWFLEIRWVMEP